MPKMILTLTQDVENYLTLSQYIKKYFNPKSKHASRIGFWLGVKFIGLGFNIKSNCLGF
jgi:hypothetical protein